MKKGIGPRGLGAPKSAAKMYGKSPAKKTGDGIKVGKTEYAEPYQNKPLSLKGQKKQGVRGYSIGDQETDRRRKFMSDSAGRPKGRLEALTARENNFGVKKPKVNIK